MSPEPNDMNESMSTFDPPEATTASPLAAGTARRMPSWSRGNLFLAAMFAAGIGGVYLLSLRSGPKKVSAQLQQDELRVDTALAALKSPVSSKSKTMELVKTFYYQTKQRQIPLRSLKGNPFVFIPPPEAKSVVPAKSQDQPDHRTRREEEKQLADALRAAKELTLQSVLMGKHETIAMISNNLLTKGRRIRGWTIVDIRPREVVLKWKDQTYLLKMAQ